MVADDIAGAVAFYASDDAKVFSGGAIALEQQPFESCWTEGPRAED